MEFNATFIVSIVSFVVFTLLMNKIFYAPVSKIISEREGLIKRTVDEANSLQSEADALNEERISKLTAAASESRKIVSDKVDQASKEASLIVSDAKKNYSDVVSANKDELVRQSEATKEELKNNVNLLADDIVGKILG